MSATRTAVVMGAATVMLVATVGGPAAEAAPTTQEAIPLSQRYGSDFDGDGRSDIAVWRPSDGKWYVRRSSDGGVTVQQWGQQGDVPVPGDYDGDRRTDFAVWRPSDGKWFLLQSRDGYRAQQWGRGNTECPYECPDKPVVGDFDADGRHDMTVVRTEVDLGIPMSWLVWRILPSGGREPFTRETPGARAPVYYPIGDFDGNGDTNLAQWEGPTGYWWIQDLHRSQKWVGTGDQPVSGDFDGDRRQDFAVYRPSNRQWAVKNSVTGQETFTDIWWTTEANVPVSGDYDGDGKSDVAVWTPSRGWWVVIPSGGGSYISVQWGTQGDIPV